MTVDTPLFSDERELRKLVREPLRSTSMDVCFVTLAGAALEGVRRSVDAGAVRREAVRRTVIGEFISTEVGRFNVVPLVGLSNNRLATDKLRPVGVVVVGFFLDNSLAVVTVESDDGVLTVGGVFEVSLHDDSLSLPCDGVSLTRL